VERRICCAEQRKNLGGPVIGEEYAQRAYRPSAAQRHIGNLFSGVRASILSKMDKYTGARSAVFLGMLLTLPLICGCAFPAHVKEASQQQLELLNQADQATSNYQQTFAAVIDAASVRYVDGQAKAAALKRSEEVMSEKRPVSILSAKVQQAMAEAKEKSEVVEGVRQLQDMKARNTKNYEDYRRYLQVTKAVQSLLNSYIATDVAPESEDVEALKSAVKELAK